MQIPTYILLAGLTTLATCATLTASPAATDITNDIYALGDKCDQLTNYITANDDTNTMITESAAEKMMSDLSEQLVNKAGTYSPEDVAMIVPAMQASTPKVIGALGALTAKAPMVAEQAPWVVPMISSAIMDLQIYADEAYGALGDAGLDSDKAALDAAFEQCIAAYPSLDDSSLDDFMKGEMPMKIVAA